jgi:hypothetical protein
MLITEFAEVATPERSEVRGQRLAEEDARPVMCAECRVITSAIIVGNNAYRCPNCSAVICVMCGCTEEFACYRRVQLVKSRYLFVA